MGETLPLFRGPSSVEPGGDWSRRLGGTSWRVFDAVVTYAKDDSLTTAEVGRLAGVTKRTARKWLRVLAKEGVARPLGVGGPGRGREERWTVEPGMPEALGWRRDWQGLQDAAAQAFARESDAFLAKLEPELTEVDQETGEIRPLPSVEAYAGMPGRWVKARLARGRQRARPADNDKVLES